MEHGTAQRHKKEVGRLPLQTVQQPKTAESGQTLVEFALMLPFMLLLLLGIVEIGRATFITSMVLKTLPLRRILSACKRQPYAMLMATSPAFARQVFLLKRRVRRISVNAIPDRELPA